MLSAERVDWLEPQIYVSRKKKEQQTVLCDEVIIYFHIKCYSLISNRCKKYSCHYKHPF